MLRYLGYPAVADQVETAIRDVIAEGRVTTHDLGGSAGTREFAAAVAERVRGA
jgi:isocitrate dehydrogenase (NAD+)